MSSPLPPTSGQGSGSGADQAGRGGPGRGGSERGGAARGRGAAPGRGRWAVTITLLVILIVPLAEIWLLLRIGDLIGLVPTLALLVLTAALGVWLTRREGARAWRALNAAITRGEIPEGELADAAMILVGGLLLLFPGYITDVLGLILLVPFTRRLIRRMFGGLLRRRLGGVPARFDLPGRPQSSPYRDGVIVEGEVIETDPGTDPPERRPGQLEG